MKTYKTFERADNFYKKKLVDMKNVFFEVQIEKDLRVNYEIALIERNSKKNLKLFKTDSLGRNIPILSDSEDISIIKIDNFNLEEKLFHIDKNIKINSNSFIKNFLMGGDLKMISKLNNKIIVQENDKINIFSLKNCDESDRFLDRLQIKLMESGNTGSLIVRDTDLQQKKYLYKFLEMSGYDKKMLYRKKTTHS